MKDRKLNSFVYKFYAKWFLLIGIVATTVVAILTKKLLASLIIFAITTLVSIFIFSIYSICYRLEIIIENTEKKTTKK